MIFSLLAWSFKEPWLEISRIFFESFNRGLVTVIMAFFVLEWILQKRLAPHLFPEGGLSAVAGTMRIRIGTRLGALFFACNLIPLISILNILRGTVQPGGSYYEQTFMQLRSAIFHDSLVFMATGIGLTAIMSRNLTRPLQNIIRILRKIRRGNLQERVNVSSNDEIGYAGDVINEMTEGLKEREKMRHSLELAMEIQKSLLPKANPEIKGLDVAGKSVYCDETGGDYYDFLNTGEPHETKLSVVVGDVSGHGIPAALLMATVRGFLRQRSSLPGSIGQIVSDVNRQLVRDVEDSSHFMTLFYLTVDPASRMLQWVRAGHDPAILFDPATGVFEELRGPGVTLGIDPDWNYEGNQGQISSREQIILIGTDGIWEAHNPRGDRFGKDPVYNVLRRNPAGSAAEIVDAVLDALHRFREGLAPEDDVTLVVMKFNSLDP